MTLDQALKQITFCADRMRAAYSDRPVFDEWAIVSLVDNKVRVLAYIGPRKQGFLHNFSQDASGLRGGLKADQHQTGDFEFARHGVGTGFESFMVIGKSRFLICNNTARSMDDIAKDPLWLGAQVPFVELSELFRQDPLC